MTLALLVVLATAQLEDANLVVFTVADDCRLDGGASDQRSADLQFGTGADCQHLIDGDLSADFCVEQFNLDRFAGSNLVCLPPVLMTAYMFFLSHPLGAHTRLHSLRRVPGLFVGFRIDPDAAHSRTNELQRARQYTPSCGLNASSAFRPKAGL